MSWDWIIARSGAAAEGWMTGRGEGGGGGGYDYTGGRKKRGGEARQKVEEEQGKARGRGEEKKGDLRGKSRSLWWCWSTRDWPDPSAVSGRRRQTPTPSCCFQHFFWSFFLLRRLLERLCFLPVSLPLPVPPLPPCPNFSSFRFPIFPSVLIPKLNQKSVLCYRLKRKYLMYQNLCVIID